MNNTDMTSIINNRIEEFRNIEFLQEDSDYCDNKTLEFIKNKITELYL